MGSAGVQAEKGTGVAGHTAVAVWDVVAVPGVASEAQMVISEQVVEVQVDVVEVSPKFVTAQST